MPRTQTITLVAAAAIAVPATAAFAVPLATQAHTSGATAEAAPTPAASARQDAWITVLTAQVAAARADNVPRAALTATRTVGRVGPASVRAVVAAKQRALAKLYTPEWLQQWAKVYMAEQYDWGADEHAALVTLWEHESSWDYREENPTSGAYGIPQSLPGSKMASIAPDWRTNPRTQIRWGLKYIQDTYGTPSAALGHFNANNWY